MTYKYYNQNNYPKVPYPCPSNTSATVQTSGCGVTSMAMIISSMTPTIVDPAIIAAYSLKIGARIDGGGTDETKLANALIKEYPLQFTTTADENALRAHLETGNMAICNVGGDRPGYIGVFSDGGHYILAAGLDTAGKVIILDPGYYAGKFNKTGRVGKVTVAGNECHCDLSVLASDTANRNPAYWLFTVSHDNNAAYNAAVDELVKDSVITGSDYWKSSIAHNIDVHGDWMASVIQKMTNQSNLNAAVNALVVAGVVHDSAYWLVNCVIGKTVSAANAKVVIIDGVSKLKL